MKSPFKIFCLYYSLTIGITVEQRKRGGKGTVNRNNQTSDTLLSIYSTII